MSELGELAAAGGAVGWLADAFVRHGLWVVLIGMLLESIVIVGMFTPGEVILVAAAAYAGQGQFNPWLVAGLGAVGGTLGSLISYEIGRHGGLPVLVRWGHHVGLSDERLAATRTYFARHGAKTVFLGRWASGVKAWVPALAGASQMPWGVFLGYSIAAAVTWSTVMTTLGYLFGANLAAVLRIVRGMGWGALVLLAAVVGLFVWRGLQRRRERRAP